ncbi:hypothetical protein DID76_03390 [Candidatus Marinamargulisbacteria bacterium SCGC AG-414-C22]|nr:hypothetical protein DID76_03390 [Candidatus Marinamargulisbacteria bacterium SCGC AG-414-C22]
MTLKRTIAIMSDSHGNLANVNTFLTKINHHNSDVIYHLGDYYDDAEIIIKQQIPCIRIPGTWSRYYQDFRFENRRYEQECGWTLFLTHTPERHFNDLQDDEDPQDVIANQKADIVLHGHTHKPNISIENNVVIVNPGHTKASFDRGYEPSYAIMKLTETTATITVYNLLNDAVVTQKTLKK